jgi:glyoxylase-like metal-dependent hydrolase (beta-lactamase superfamily II)
MKWAVGNVEVWRIVEIEALEFPSEFVTGGVAAEQVLALDWMQPHFCNSEGQLRMSFHAFLVRTNDKTILIDTCLGAGRDMPTPLFSGLDRRFIDNLSAAGVGPEDVDIVMCTHMHYDHVGWNTQMGDGQWVPTFPNAGDSHAFYFGDTILPPVTAGLVDFIDSVDGYQLGEEISLISTPGHSADHFSVLISSQGEHAVITGDVMHNPVQCAYPDHQPVADEDKPLAADTRRKFLERFADSHVLVLGTHFPAPTAGYFRRSRDAWEFDVGAPGP